MTSPVSYWNGRVKEEIDEEQKGAISWWPSSDPGCCSAVEAKNLKRIECY